jgi:VanZ family protein
LDKGKDFLKYWLPPLVWGIFIFPLSNHYLSQSWTYTIIVSVIRWFLPNASNPTIETLYIVSRKSFHFIEYAILAFLLIRAFRGSQKRIWSWRWAVSSGLVTIGYGLLDEFVQTFIPSRNGSLLDWAVDSAGALFALGIMAIKREK